MISTSELKQNKNLDEKTKLNKDTKQKKEKSLTSELKQNKNLDEKTKLNNNTKQKKEKSPTSELKQKKEKSPTSELKQKKEKSPTSELKQKKEKLLISKLNNDIQLDEKNNNKILIPCKIPDFVQIDTLKKYVKKDVDSNIEYFDDLKITYKISDPKKAEWIMNKSIENSKLIGNGNTNIDISIDNNIGIDVSVLTLNGNYTNEKSVMQNFSCSNELDTLFNTNQGYTAVEIFKNKFQEKCSFKNGEKRDIYYMIFICNKKNVYISCLKLNPEFISNMKFSKFTKLCKNISIDNFIDIKFGNVKLDKSKKRLELRLHKDIINNYCTTKLY